MAIANCYLAIEQQPQHQLMNGPRKAMSPSGNHDQI